MQRVFPRLFIHSMLIAMAVFTPLPASPAFAATFTATNEAELVTAITNANANVDLDTVFINVTGPLTLTAPLPNLQTDMIVQGLGAATTTVSGNALFRVFFVEAGTVIFRDLTLDNGSAVGNNGGVGSFGGAGGGSAGMGGGIFVNGIAGVTLENCIVSNCQAIGGSGGNSTASVSRGGAGGAGFAGNGATPGADDGADGGGGLPLLGVAGTGGLAGADATGGANGGTGNPGMIGGDGSAAGGGGAGGDVTSGAGTGGIGGVPGLSGFGAGGSGGGSGGDAESTGASDGGIGVFGGTGGYGAGGGGAGSGGAGGATGTDGISGTGGLAGDFGGDGGDATSTGGAGGGGAGLGGGIYVRLGGSVFLIDSTIQNNSATGGAGGLGQAAPEDGTPGMGKGGGLFIEPGATAGERGIFVLTGNTASDDLGGTEDNDDVFGAIFAIQSFEGGGACFIASAAYGTPLAQEIDVLRNFRDAFLLDNFAGSVLVDGYYRISPSLAPFVSQHSLVAFAVRCVLYPLVVGLGLLLKFPILIPIGVIGLVAALIVILGRRRLYWGTYTSTMW